MAEAYSAIQNTSSYGNVNMDIRIFRGAVTRTKTSVSFGFGVAFMPTTQSTSNSIAAYYGGIKRFAYSNKGQSFDEATVKAKRGQWCYAYYDNRSKMQIYTSEHLCFTYTNDSISASTSSVNITVGVGWMNWAGDQVGSLTFSLPIPVWREGGKTPSLGIEDKGCNYAKITCTMPAESANNPLNGAILYYILNNSANKGRTAADRNATVWGLNEIKSGERRVFDDIPITDGTVEIAAALECYFDYSDYTESTARADVIYYKGPSKQAGTPVLAQDFDRSRPTIKERWTYRWVAATPGNTNSEIKGYIIRLFKNGKTIQLRDPDTNAALGEVQYPAGGTDYFYNRSGNSTEITFDPAKCGIVAGDKIKLEVSAYSLNAAGGMLSAASGLAATSAETTVASAGTVRVKVPDKGWVEGQVWVKQPTPDGKSSQWYEAETVYTKTSEGWKESQ